MGGLDKMLSFIAVKLNTLIHFISRILPEIMVLMGLFFIVDITFKLNLIAGYYCLGGILLLIGLILSKVR
jgi:hypothetical protein